jgi:hypothetical protein
LSIDAFQQNTTSIMVKRTSSEIATSPTETELTLLKKSRRENKSASPVTTLMLRLPSSRRQGTGTNDIFRELPGQSTNSYHFTLKNAVTVDEDTDPRTEHDSDTCTFPSPAREKHPPQLALQMRLSDSSNPYLRQDSPTFDDKVAVLPQHLPPLVAVAEFNTGLVTPKLSPASRLSLSPPPPPARKGSESEKDIIPTRIPAELLFPVLA